MRDAADRLLSQMFGSSRYAVLPLTSTYVLGAAAVAVTSVLLFGANWPGAVLLGSLLGGIAALISPLLWAWAWIVHRVLSRVRTRTSEHDRLRTRIDELEEIVAQNSVAVSGLKYSAEMETRGDSTSRGI